MLTFGSVIVGSMFVTAYFIILSRPYNGVTEKIAEFCCAAGATVALFGAVYGVL